MGLLSVYRGLYTTIALSGKPRIKERHAVVLFIFSFESYAASRDDMAHSLKIIELL